MWVYLFFLGSICFSFYQKQMHDESSTPLTNPPAHLLLPSLIKLYSAPERKSHFWPYDQMNQSLFLQPSKFSHKLPFLTMCRYRALNRWRIKLLKFDPNEAPWSSSIDAHCRILYLFSLSRISELKFLFISLVFPACLFLKQREESCSVKRKHEFIINIKMKQEK